MHPLPPPGASSSPLHPTLSHLSSCLLCSSAPLLLCSFAPLLFSSSLPSPKMPTSHISSASRIQAGRGAPPLFANERYNKDSGHLGCYLPGVLALAAHHFPERYGTFGRE